MYLVVVAPSCKRLLGVVRWSMTMGVDMKIVTEFAFTRRGLT